MNRALVTVWLVAFAGLAQARPRLVEFALVLDDAPAASKVASQNELRGPEAQAQLVRVRSAQQRVRADLVRRKISVLGSSQILLNAVFVVAPVERADELRQVAGVRRVQQLPRLKCHLFKALDLMNVRQAWTAVGGDQKAGLGIRIGIIDSGIDQTHPGFQDPSLPFPAGFPKGDTAYTNNKVIVARSYVSYVTSADDPVYSRPDDLSPRDRSGHGTAIAMIAAGASNTGPLGTIEGVAPKAQLGSYKIFGTPTVNDYTYYAALLAAMDDAFNDGMQIVTLSLGEGDPPLAGALDRDCGTGSNDVCDVRSQAIETATSKGMVVVASAGNSGDFGLQFPALNTVHTPGIAPSAITVGAITNSHIFYNGVRVEGGTTWNALFGAGPQLTAPLTAPLIDVATVGPDALACVDLPAGSLAGKVALVARGNCAFGDKAYYVQRAGAIALLVYQQPGYDFPDKITDQDVGIPTAMVGNRDGVTLRAASGRNVTLDPALREVNASFNSVWNSSSRGPAIASYAIKPEVAAIGTDLYTAAQRLDPNGDAYNATGYVSVTGTSFAVPMVAGAAALVKQQNGSLTPAQIKSAVVNTATQDVTNANGQARVTDVGAGKMNAAAAVAVGLVAEPSTISFPANASLTAGALPVSRTLTITNVSASAANITIAVQQRDPDSHATVRVQPTTAQIPAGSRQIVTVTLSGTIPVPGNYEGMLEISGAGTTLHVPYLYLVGDSTPYNAFPVVGSSFVGAVGDDFWNIAMRVTDRYGVPQSNMPVLFKVTQGGGKILLADLNTDRLGVAYANIALGTQVGPQVFTGTVAGLTVEFDGYAFPFPAIASGGVVDAASNRIGKGLAPGSYISIYGSALADTTALASTLTLPLGLARVSVSFDAPGISVPGHLLSVSPGQVNVQIPWELQGQSSAKMKVVFWDIPTDVYTLPLATTSPAIFVRGGVAAARDINFAVIDASNPAKRGQAVQLYVNGLGPVDHTPGSGEPTPTTQPLAQTGVPASVTIGGKPAQVLYSGLAPGIVGLYQVNVVVPADAGTGSQPVVVSIGGVDSQPVNMPVQ